MDAWFQCGVVEDAPMIDLPGIARQVGDRACEAALEHFAHHREIVPGLRFGALDVELAIGALDPALGPRDDHGTQGIGALDMAVVIDFDALRRLIEVEQLGEFAAELGLAAALGEPPVEFLARVTHCLFEQASPVAALGYSDLDLAPRRLAERLGEKRAFGGNLVSSAPMKQTV